MNYIKPLTIALAAIISLSTLSTAEAATRRRSSSGSNESWYSRSLPTKARTKVSLLQKQDPLKVIPIPILLGVKPGDFTDTWGEARSQGRTHEGTDIMAPKDAYVVAPTDSVVSDIGFGANGGNFAYTINPGGERYYFAHLDKYADDLKVGDILEQGDLIGYVGNTGNASGGATHLHFSIYANGAQNPFDRLTETLTTSTRIDAVEKIIGDADDSAAEARIVVGSYATFFRQAVAQGYDLPGEITISLASAIATPSSSGGGVVGARDLTVGSQGSDVVKLQAFLIAQAKGSAAIALKGAGATGYFGSMTRAALAEWQAAAGISPAVGYYGPITRSRMSAVAVR